MDREELLLSYETKIQDLEHQVSELTLDKMSLRNSCAVLRYSAFIIGWLCLNIWLSPLIWKEELNFFIGYLVVLAASATGSFVLFFIGHGLTFLVSTGTNDFNGTKLKLYIAIPLLLLTPLIIHYLPWFLYNT